MANVRAKPSGKLYFDFRYMNQRCRETTELSDTVANRKRLESIMKKISAEIMLGTFDYEAYFPNSNMVSKVKKQTSPKPTGLPTINECATTWLIEHEIEWRINYRNVIVGIIEKHIRPHLGGLTLCDLSRDDIVRFRNHLARHRSSTGAALKPATINRVITVLKAIVEQACFVHKLPTPFERIKKLKEEKRSVEPFTIDEMNRMLADVRADFRDYLIVKFFTGLRTAEINGLRWKYVDLDRGEILIRETFCKGRFDYTKNDYSQREIRITTIVREALERQLKVTGHFGKDGVVFCTRNGNPLDDHNFCNRIWKPMLEDLNIPYRRPYNTRHTAATIMLASGESPEWVARQLGHANTQMLFTVYSRFVPNLTRNDGSALDRLLANTIQAV